MRFHGQIIFLFARLLPNLIGLVTAAVLTRLLKPTEYGFYALGLSITYFLTLAGFDWLGLSLLRLAPANKQPEVFLGTVVTCFCAVCALSIVIAALVLVLGQIPDYAVLVTACLIATFAAAWFELELRLKMAELRQADYFWMSVGRSAITIILVCTTAYFSRNAPLIILALATSYIIASFIRQEPRLSFRNLRLDFSLYPTLLRFGLPLSVSAGPAAILMSVDRWLLQGLSGADAVGFFSAAIVVAQMPIGALAAGIGPPAYSMAVQALEFRSREAANAQLAQNFTVLLGIVAPAAAGIVALSNNLAHLMVGAIYWQSVDLLAPWLCAAAVLSALRSFYIDTAFQLAHRTQRLIWTTLVIVAVNVALDLWLIPKLGELGAAIGSCVALFIGFVTTAIATRGVFRLPMPFVDTAKVLTSTVIMFLVLHQLNRFSGALALACQIGIGLLIYVSGLIALDLLGVRGQLARHTMRQCAKLLRATLTALLLLAAMAGVMFAAIYRASSWVMSLAADRRPGSSS